MRCRARHVGERETKAARACVWERNERARRDRQDLLTVTRREGAWGSVKSGEGLRRIKRWLQHSQGGREHSIGSAANDTVTQACGVSGTLGSWVPCHERHGRLIAML